MWRASSWVRDCDRLSERTSLSPPRYGPRKSTDLPGETFRLICGALAAAAPINGPKDSGRLKFLQPVERIRDESLCAPVAGSHAITLPRLSPLLLRATRQKRGHVFARVLLLKRKFIVSFDTSRRFVLETTGKAPFRRSFFFSPTFLHRCTSSPLFQQYRFSSSSSSSSSLPVLQP